jgi:hypothetical protein
LPGCSGMVRPGGTVPSRQRLTPNMTPIATARDSTRRTIVPIIERQLNLIRHARSYRNPQWTEAERSSKPLQSTAHRREWTRLDDLLILRIRSLAELARLPRARHYPNQRAPRWSATDGVARTPSDEKSAG